MSLISTNEFFTIRGLKVVHSCTYNKVLSSSTRCPGPLNPEFLVLLRLHFWPLRATPKSTLKHSMTSKADCVRDAVHTDAL